MFTVRRMRPDDKPAIEDISSRIWDGTDYIPEVFDEWVGDRAGEFTAVLLDGRVVGCAKLTFWTDTDAWLEGLRKDPRVEEKGLARTVALHQLGLLARRAAPGAAQAAALTSVRFATHITNVESIAVNERLGFRRRVALSLKGWEGSVEDCTAPRPDPAQCVVQDVRDVDLVCAYVERSGYLAAATNLIVDGWHCLPYSRECIASRYIPRCRGAFRGDDLAGLCISTVHVRPLGAQPGTTANAARPGGAQPGTVEDTARPGGAQPGTTASATIAFLDAADDEAAGALFDDLRGRLRDASAERCVMEWMVPGLQRLKGWCAAWGLASEVQEDDFLVYELPLERLAAFSE